LAHNPSTKTTNREYQARWKLTNKSAEIEIYSRVNSDLFNVPRFLLPGEGVQIKFMKSKSDLYDLSSKADTGGSHQIP
jgi:hypothetical protein